MFALTTTSENGREPNVLNLPLNRNLGYIGVAHSLSGDQDVRLLCSLGGHRRSRRRIRRTKMGEFESVCKHCGVSMIRIQHRVWRVKNEADRQELETV
jgi:hypothetical protein